MRAGEHRQDRHAEGGRPVPLGALGKPAGGLSQRVTERVELIHGHNKIEVSALSRSGIESLRDYRIVNYSEPVKGDLYFIGFGVSHYRNSAYDLRYPHKDALDLADTLKQSTRSFREVHAVYQKRKRA